MKIGLALVGMLLAGAPASGAELRELCADRPGIDTPACTVDAGHLQIEAGGMAWTRDAQSGTRTDTMIIGDMAARLGVGPSTELRAGWRAYGRERERDRTAGTTTTAHRTGDATFGLKQNVSNPDGSGFSAALLPSITVPIGRRPIGDGTWSAGMLVPLSWEVSPDIHVQLTPEADAAANESGHGRHLAAGSAAGIELGLSKTLDLDLEVQAIRDRDPSGHSTMALAAASLAYGIGENLQLDVGGVAGLNHASPDVRAYWGIVRRF